MHRGGRDRHNEALSVDLEETVNYDQWLAALTIWRECRGGTMAQMNAIWWVIQNRANDEKNRWPKTIPGVILQPYQFSSFNSSDPNSLLFPNPSHPPDWNAFLSVQTVVTAPLGSDPTLGATNYESLPDGLKKPAWCDPSKITLELGNFRFYRI